MHIIWAILLIVIPGIAFVGQLFSLISPRGAAKAGLTEREAEVDPAFYADVRGEALWDSLTLWTLPTAGVLGLLNKDSWIWLCLVGGGMYAYFAGRGVLTRLSCQRRSIAIGSKNSIFTAITFLASWGLSGIAAIVLALGAIK
jgi:hypothetical protein